MNEPETVVTAVPVRDIPDAHLLLCPPRPPGLPEHDHKLTPEMAAALERILPAYGAIAFQLASVVNWFNPGSCPLEGYNGR